LRACAETGIDAANAIDHADAVAEALDPVAAGGDAGGGRHDDAADLRLADNAGGWCRGPGTTHVPAVECIARNHDRAIAHELDAVCGWHCGGAGQDDV